MKQRLADYVADFLVKHGVTDCFSVVGGGAMHLNDALGHKQGLHVTYNHHEQACAIAAEAYARLNNQIAAVCVTTGPGGTNAITGVVGGWLDSIPMLIISGQVRYDTTARYAEKFTNGLHLRSVGDQEYDIVKSVEPMTKYATMIEDPNQIRYALEKAWFLARSGRPGPVWIDIPVNFQGCTIDTDQLKGYDPKEDMELLPKQLETKTIQTVLQKIQKAKRPVIYAGGGVRLSGAFTEFRKLVDKLNVPVVTYWNSIDLMENDHRLYVGRGGNMGERAGNFAVQNADLIIALGTRISIRQTGYDFKTWAREAEVIMVNIDQAEFYKHTIHVDLPIWADCKDFIALTLKQAEKIEGTVFNGNDWIDKCHEWKTKYPVTLPKHWEDSNLINVYAFINYLSNALPEGSLTAVSNGACCVVGSQNYVIKKDTRFIINNAIASMGYGLPAAIGLCQAAQQKSTICLEGDGSIMMNLQELQTIITNRLPIKIFLINNGGYHSIRITQENLFKEHCKVGIGEESNDLGFPNFKKLAKAFNFPYYQAKNVRVMKKVINKVLNLDGPVFCEIFTNTTQVWEPKSSAKRLPDGTIVSPPLEDLAPFLPRDEFLANMIIQPISENKD